MGRFPLAGVGWQALQYFVGLQRLGFEVFYVEDAGAPPYDPAAVALAEDARANVDFVRDVMSRTETPDAWLYYDVLRDEHHGLGRDAARELYETCDQIWNLCGATRLGPEHRHVARRVYVQTDPGYEQIRLGEGDGSIKSAIDAHDVLFTYGENLARPGAALESERRWHPTRPPVLLDVWSTAPPDAGAAFSTVGSWKNTGKDALHEGVVHRWSKEDAFRRVIEVPARAGVRVEAALAPPDDEAAEMRASGWSFRDPRDVSSDLDAYRDFVHGSAGEFTAAKDIYVGLRSGWFSDRSATYLASGRPVVTEDTGSPVPTDGFGLRTYRSADDAANALRDVAANLQEHAEGARALATEWFGAERVLGAMLEVISP